MASMIFGLVTVDPTTVPQSQIFTLTFTANAATDGFGNGNSASAAEQLIILGSDAVTGGSGDENIDENWPGSNRITITNHR